MRSYGVKVIAALVLLGAIGSDRAMAFGRGRSSSEQELLNKDAAALPDTSAIYVRKDLRISGGAIDYTNQPRYSGRVSLSKECTINANSNYEAVIAKGMYKIDSPMVGRGDLDYDDAIHYWFTLIPSKQDYYEPVAIECVFRGGKRLQIKDLDRLLAKKKIALKFNPSVCKKYWNHDLSRWELAVDGNVIATAAMDEDRPLFEKGIELSQQGTCLFDDRFDNQ